MKRSARFSSAAFSLVEITLAIGIVAFAFVALLGLLPVGLGTLRAALDTSVRAQIVQRISTELQQTDFDKVPERAKTRRFFDDEGSEINTAAKATHSIYTAEATVVWTQRAAGNNQPENLRLVLVKIAYDPGRSPQVFKESGEIPFTQHPVFIARNR